MYGPTKITDFRINFAKNASGRILDCAAGQGAFQQYFSSDDIISLDLSTGQLKNLKKKKVCASATLLPFKDNVFDTVWACGLVQYIRESLEAYLSEWIRVTKHGGKIFVFTPNKISPFNFLCNLLGHKSWDRREGVVRLYAPTELAQFGKVYGEIWFLPFIKNVTARHPRWAHTEMLEITVKK
ncbi:class I SAM-dependent methyltransferase [Candidatus Omnitrophota bacterium]